LLACAAAASRGDRTGALAISQRLRCRHRDTAAALVKDSAALQTMIEQEFEALDEVLRGLAAILELTPRISDLVVS
jgi:aspartate kinase